MELSILIAKIISVIYIATGAGILAGTIDFNEIVNDFEKSPALTFVSGAVGIIAGLFLTAYHNIWIYQWIVLITAIGWMALIGGVIVVIFPKTLSLYKEYFKINKIWGLFMVLFGLATGYFGFLA